MNGSLHLWRFPRILLAIASLLILGSGAGPSIAQPALKGKISGGFQAPTSMDAQGRRHVLKGENAESRGTNTFEITDPRVISYNSEDEPEMFIDAPKALLDTRSNIASSESALSVRTADGRFAIQGVGWQWDPSSSELAISNQVVALVQKSAIAGETNAAGNETNEPVRITANAFRQVSDQASFIGNVRVKDGTDTLNCERLNLEILRPGGVQKIEALGSMELKQQDTVVRSGRALYDLKENTIRISDEPNWIAGTREGSADLLLLDRSNQTLFAEGSVYMKLPMTNVVDGTEAGNRDRLDVAPIPSPARFLEIRSDRFNFQEGRSNRVAEAVYESNVKVVHPQATILCDRLTAGFGPDDRLNRITAGGGVEIQSDGNRAFGGLAVYDMVDEKITLTDNPHWKMDERTGRSEVLVFYPKTEEIFALHNVQMVLPGPSGMLPDGTTNQSATNTTTVNTNAPLRITAETFSHGGAVSVFNNNVTVSDDRGRMTCELLTVLTDATNQVQRILAEKGVQIHQQDMIASGDRAEYNVETGLVELTGDPRLKSADKELQASKFIIDRTANTFSVAPGRYRIKLQVDDKNSRQSLKR